MEHSKPKTFQERLELNIGALTIMIAIAVSAGGIFCVVPLFLLDSTYEDTVKFPELDGVRPYTALEQAGRDIYIREGCYTCHSQMIRPFRDELERYGHYSLAVESKYDHPFQWGSKRTGPDLARVGGKYSNEWHVAHLTSPRAVVPESVMPNYPWFKTAMVDADAMPGKLSALRMVGVPYTDADIAGAKEAVAGKTEMDAMVAYLQCLGTMIKFEEGKAYRE